MGRKHRGSVFKVAAGSSWLQHNTNTLPTSSQVDILTWRTKNQRVHAQIKDICAILSGLMVAQDYKKGQDLIRDKNFADNEEFFQVGMHRWG